MDTIHTCWFLATATSCTYSKFSHHFENAKFHNYVFKLRKLFMGLNKPQELGMNDLANFS